MSEVLPSLPDDVHLHVLQGAGVPLPRLPRRSGTLKTFLRHSQRQKATCCPNVFTSQCANILLPSIIPN